MTTISESALDYNEEVRFSSGVDYVNNIPTEILYYIFKKLDLPALRSCFAVNRKWREVAESICELQDLWQDLAEDGIVNHGIMHHFKSTLSWKQLYFNSVLWNNIQSASINKVHEMEKLDINRIHVYRDKLIVVSSMGVEYYDIEFLRRIRVFQIALCEDLQETDDILMLVLKIMGCHDYYRVNVFIKANKDEAINVAKYLNGWPTSTPTVTDLPYTFDSGVLWRIVGNNGYVIDSRSVLWKCSVTDGKLSIKSLSRYCGISKFSSMHVLNSIHVIKEDVYVVLVWGALLEAGKDMMFRKVNAEEIPTKVIPFKQPPVWRGKFDVLITTPPGVAFREMTSQQNLLHFHYDDPEMTSGLQHGDVVFQGFFDGRVKITVLGDHSEVELNVKNFDKDIKDPAVISLEVCEVEHRHMLFIATRDKLYTLLVTYSKNILDTWTI